MPSGNLVLRNVILIGTYMSLPKEGAADADDGKVYSIDKNLMTKNLMCETTLFTNFTNRKTAAHFSGTGLRLLSTKYNEEHDVNVLWLRQAWLPDGYSQIFRIVCVWPFGLLDYGSATLRCKI